MLKLVPLVIGFALCCTLALAADVDGKWEGVMPNLAELIVNEKVEFKAEGEQLTGRFAGPIQAHISDGKVSGDVPAVEAASDPAPEWYKPES